jgi:hypothetical protein
VLQQQAQEDIAEAAACTSEGQTENAELALDAYGNTVAQIVSLMNNMNSDSDFSQNLVAAITAKNASNILVLGNLIESQKLPPQAAERILTNAVKKLTRCIAKLEDKEARIQLKNKLKATTEELGDIHLDEDTELALNETDEENAVNGDVTCSDVTEEESEDNNDGKDLNRGQTKKAQRQENNINSDTEGTDSGFAVNGVDDDNDGVDDVDTDDQNQQGDKNKGNGNGNGKGGTR